MLKPTTMPLMIGDSVNEVKKSYKRINYFIHNDGICTMKEKGNERRDISFEEPALYAKSEGTLLPNWLIYDKMVLCFKAYLREHIAELMGYNYIIRKCKIYFFLEDGTIKVTEEKNPQSHYPQAGCIIGRQKVHFPATGNSSDYYDVIDLNVGKSVELVGRIFHITDCDVFTRTFLNRLGISVPDPQPVPEDPFEALRQEQQKSKKKAKEGRKKKTLDEFLAMDARILCFDAYWDDRNAQYGYVHLLKVLYYLLDDAIEIKDVTEKGRSETIVRKGKLPKEPSHLVGLGKDSPGRYLNILGVGLTGNRTMVDPLSLSDTKEYYCDKDLTIGTVIDAFGKRVVLISCDKFTQDYYRIKYGLDDFTPLKRPLTEEEEECKTRQEKSFELPPFNGFGSYEDSVRNCLSVIPSAINKSYKKFYEKDRFGYDSRILRFSAKLISDIPENDRRNFIICLFVVDDTVSVYETAKDCFDCLGATMMARRVIYKPGQDMYSSNTPECYGINDFYLGNIVTLESHTFLLSSADEYAFKYMEQHPNEFPKSNINLIMDKIRTKVRLNYKNFASNFFSDGKLSPVNYCTLRKVLMDAFENEISEQEVMTVARHFSINPPREKFSLETLRRYTHDELKRQLYDDYGRLCESLREKDPDNVGKISREDAYTVLRGARVPLDTALINIIITKFSTGDKCEIVYEDLLNFLNYKKYPSTPLKPINIPGNMSWMNLYQPQNNLTLDCIDMEKFIEAMGLEGELKQEC